MEGRGNTPYITVFLYRFNRATWRAVSGTLMASRRLCLFTMLVRKKKPPASVNGSRRAGCGVANHIAYQLST